MKTSTIHPKVSIIMATYNRANILGKAIKSVLNQSFKNYELIIVNDGSTDNTEKVVKTYKDHRIVYLKKRHSGLAKSRNCGLKIARGKYIAYCDDDSIYYSFYLLKLVDFLDANPNAGVVYSDGLVCFPGKRPFRKGYDFDKRRLETRNFLMVITLMHRRECFDKAGYFDEKLPSSVDWDMWLRFSDHYSFYHLPVITGTHLSYEDIPFILSTSKNRHISKMRIIQKRAGLAKRNGRILEYIEGSSIGIVNNLIESGGIKEIHELSNYFYKIVKNYQTIACLGLCAFAKYNFKEAKKLFEESIKGLPKKWQGLDSWHIENILTIKTFLAHTYYFLDNILEAEKIYKEVLNVMPDNMAAKTWLAKCYVRIGLLSKALRLLKKCGYSSTAYNLRGICYLGNSNYSKAAQNFKIALIAFPTSITYRYNLAITYMGLGKHKKAEEELRKILKLAPKHPLAKKILYRISLCKKDIPLCPRVSIIMPTYNRAHIIKRAIKSVLTQAFKNYELIIVNDGSTDNTKKVVNSFKDRRIVYLEKKWSGVSSARNLGLKYAIGDYISYLDDDDEYKPNHLRELVNFLDDNPQYGMAYTDSIYVVNKTDILPYKPIPFNKRRLEISNFIPLTSIMHRRECIDKVDFFDEKMLAAEDLDMWLRISDVYKIGYLSKRTNIVNLDQMEKITVKNRGKFYKYLIQKRVSKLKKSKGLIDYINDCAIGVVNNLNFLNQTKFAKKLSYKFYKIVKNYQTIACLGMVSLSRGKFINARKLLEIAINKLPRMWKKQDALRLENILKIKTYLGITYCSLSRYDIAEKIFREVLSLMPDNTAAKAQLAKLLMEQGLFKEAFNFIKKPECDSLTYNLRGVYYIKREEYKKGMREFKNALILDPNSNIYRHNLNVVYSKIKNYAAH